MRHRRLAGVGLALALAVAPAGCAREPAASRLVELSGPTMGTTWSVKLVPGEEGLGPERSQELDKAIRDDLARINLLMSTWDPESELSRFNRSPSVEPFAVAPETAAVFRWAIELAALTDGALDVTMAPLVEAWGFGPAEGRVTDAPDDERVARLRERTGVHLLELDPEGRWVRKVRPDVQVDFSSLAPGYAADRLAALLERRGFPDFVVDVGGELVARGRNDRGEPWQIAIERPDARGRVAARIVPVTGTAIATSGDYRNYREVDGRRVTHILDPRTGRPIRHRLASVTIVDPLCVRADGLATALMVLGPDEAMALAERRQLAALLLVRSDGGGFEERVSPAFAAFLDGVRSGQGADPEPSTTGP